MLKLFKTILDKLTTGWVFKLILIGNVLIFIYNTTLYFLGERLDDFLYDTGIMTVVEIIEVPFNAVFLDENISILFTVVSIVLFGYYAYDNVWGNHKLEVPDSDKPILHLFEDNIREDNSEQKVWVTFTEGLLPIILVYVRRSTIISLQTLRTQLHFDSFGITKNRLEPKTLKDAKESISNLGFLDIDDAKAVCNIYHVVNKFMQHADKTFDKNQKDKIIQAYYDALKEQKADIEYDIYH